MGGTKVLAAACLAAFAACQSAPLQAQALPPPDGTDAAQPPARVPRSAPPPSAPSPSEPSPSEPSRPSAPQAYVPRATAMTFRIATGTGPGGAKRWISATGQIQRDSARQFATFLRQNSVDGLTVVLDSQGGAVNAAMEIARAIRARKLNTTVGRTVKTDTQEMVRSNNVRCASACVLILMGGVERAVPEDARVEVHMFSVELDADGNKARAEPTFRDIEQAQRGMARHAVFVSEMGVAAAYLDLMTQASFRGPTRRLSREEITRINLARVGRPVRHLDEEAPAVWALAEPSAPPQLVRTSRLPTNNSARVIEHELVLDCDGVRGFFQVTYRQVLAEAGGQPPRQAVQRVRLDSGGWDFEFRAQGRTLVINREGGDLWMRRSVPRKVFEDAVANGKLVVAVAEPEPSRASDDIYDPSLARHLPELARRCDARPGLVTVGPHPRH